MRTTATVFHHCHGLACLCHASGTTAQHVVCCPGQWLSMHHTIKDNEPSRRSAAVGMKLIFATEQTIMPRHCVHVACFILLLARDEVCVSVMFMSVFLVLPHSLCSHSMSCSFATCIFTWSQLAQFYWRCARSHLSPMLYLHLLAHCSAFRHKDWSRACLATMCKLISPCAWRERSNVECA